MKIKAIKTRKIAYPDDDLLKILDTYLPRIKEKTIVAITSKIVSICEGRVVKVGKIDKEKLIEKEADFILSSRGKNKYGIMDYETIENPEYEQYQKNKRK